MTLQENLDLASYWQDPGAVSTICWLDSVSPRLRPPTGIAKVPTGIIDPCWLYIVHLLVSPSSWSVSPDTHG